MPSWRGTAGGFEKRFDNATEWVESIAIKWHCSPRNSHTPAPPSTDTDIVSNVRCENGLWAYVSLVTLDHACIRSHADRRVTPMNESPSLDSEKNESIERRRCNGDRRQTPAEGYACISVVGWICRREQARRKDDKMECFLAEE